MIQEFIESLLTPTTREARALGYLHESIAMRHRYLRNQEEWREHLEECQRQTLKHLGNAKTIEILGSGPLLDVPMKELIERCEQVTLVDFVHPREVRRLWDKHPKVRLIESDLLGIASPLLSWRGGTLPKPRPHQPTAEFVLSANCLSQLPLKPRQYLSGRIDEITLETYARDLTEAHLNSIKGRPHLLISDFETRLLDDQGKVAEKSAPDFDFTRLELLNSWTWRLAPPGEIHRRKSIEMSAGAFIVR